MAAERRHRTHDGAQVARIGDVVQRDQQRGRAVVGGGREQVVGMGVVVRRHLQRDALVQAVGAHPVQVVTRHLEDRDAGIGCARDGFGEPLVGLGAERDVQRGRGHPGAQALQHRVAAEHDLGVVGLLAGRPCCCCGLLRTLGGGVVGPHVRGRGGAAALEPAPAHPAGPDRRALLGAGFADRAPALRIARHLRSCTRPAAPTAARRRCR